MSFDGVFLYHLIHELNPSLVGSRCEDIVLHEKNFIFHMYKQKRKFSLHIDLSANQNRLFTVDHQEKYDQKSSFLTTLKQHLERSVITRLQQYQTDRVMLIDFVKVDPFKGDITYTLVIEFMGKHANMILCQDFFIIDTFKRHLNLDSRSVLPNIKFEFFPSDKKSLTELKLPFECDAAYYTRHYLGLSTQTAHFMLLHQVHPLDLNVTPTLHQNQKYCFFIEDGTVYKSLNVLMQTHDTSIPLNKHAHIQPLLEKARLKNIYLYEDLYENDKKMIYKTYIERIYQEYDLTIKLSQLDDIPLDSSKTLKDMALYFSKEYKKAKRGLLHIQEQIDKNTHLIEVLENLEFDFMKQTLSSDELNMILSEMHLIKKHTSKSKQKKMTHNICHLHHSVILYGKNAIQNDFVTHQLADKHDLFIHVKDAPGSHVILKHGYDEKAFDYALKLALFHSKLKLAGKGEVLYTKKMNISKIPGIFGSTVRIKHFHSQMVTLEENFKELCD